MVRSVFLIPLLSLALVLSSVAVVLARDAIAVGLTIDPTGRRDEDIVRLDRLIENRGLKPAIWTVWSNWGSRGGNEECLPGVGRCAFPSETVAALLEREITPFIWWQPAAPPGKARGEFARYVHTIQGRHDDYIREWAAAAAAQDGDILVRYAHEMNGRWYPWAITRFDNSPERYVRAWRHIWRIFQEEGVTNVKWVWAPSREGCKGCEPNYGYESFYPGNRYVDYIALSAYNKADRRWRTMASMLEKAMVRMRLMTRSDGFPNGKPVILDEVGTVHTGGSKAAWLTDGYNEVFRRWPRVKAIVYFDVNMTTRNERHPDWRLKYPSDGSALDAFASLAAMPRFKGAIGRFPQTPPQAPPEALPKEPPLDPPAEPPAEPPLDAPSEPPLDPPPSEPS